MPESDQLFLSGSGRAKEGYDIMKFGEIVAPSMKELFIQRIEDFILSGELRPGDRLPSERELADEMKISKTVVHEGIRELVRCGFLDVVPRRGVTVADYSNSGNLNTLLAIMKRNGRAMDPALHAAFSTCAVIWNVPQ